MREVKNSDSMEEKIEDMRVIDKLNLMSSLDQLYLGPHTHKLDWSYKDLLNDFPDCLPRVMFTKLICKVLEFEDNFRVKTSGCFWCSSWLLPQSYHHQNLNNNLHAISIFQTVWILIDGFTIHVPADSGSDLADLGF